MKAKDAIARELIAGRLSLAEATRQVIEMPGATEFLRRFVRDRFPGATAEESVSRHVIQWTCDLLEREPRPGGADAAAAASGVEAAVPFGRLTRPSATSHGRAPILPGKGRRSRRAAVVE